MKKGIIYYLITFTLLFMLYNCNNQNKNDNKTSINKAYRDSIINIKNNIRKNENQFLNGNWIIFKHIDEGNPKGLILNKNIKIEINNSRIQNYRNDRLYLDDSLVFKKMFIYKNDTTIIYRFNKMKTDILYYYMKLKELEWDFDGKDGKIEVYKKAN